METSFPKDAGVHQGGPTSRSRNGSVSMCWQQLVGSSTGTSARFGSVAQRSVPAGVPFSRGGSAHRDRTGTPARRRPPERVPVIGSRLRTSRRRGRAGDGATPALKIAAGETVEAEVESISAEEGQALPGGARARSPARSGPTQRALRPGMSVREPADRGCIRCSVVPTFERSIAGNQRVSILVTLELRKSGSRSVNFFSLVGRMRLVL